MKILAMDSTALTATVAVTDNGELLAEYTLRNGNTHSETLLPMVEHVLSSLGLSASDIDLFAVANGPGSFTGVRIGVATVKGLAFGQNKPCIGVSALEALAGNLCSFSGLICPVMNARRSQVYTALFRSDGERLTRLCEDVAMSTEALDAYLAAFGEPVHFCGDGYELMTEAVKRTQALPTCDRLRHQSAYSVAAAALRAYERGEAVSDAALSPTYLRLPQAERERLERLQKNKE